MQRRIPPKYRPFLLAGGVFVGFVGIVGLAFLVWLMGQLPPLDTLSNYEPSLITRVYDRNGDLLTEYADQRREIVPLERMPEHLIYAFLAAEDADFYDHFGIQPLGILRAAWKNLVAGGVVQGGSTITQQVARTFFLTQQRTIIRKLKEVLLALRLEANLSKDEILFLYLNQIYLGRGAYGVGAASTMYFAKPVWKLDVFESAILAGLPPAPSRYAPHVSPELARRRQLYVLERMVANKWLGEAEADLAATTPVAIREWNSPFWQAPYAADAVRQWLMERFGEDAVLRGGLNVYTTIDLKASRAAAEAVRSGLEALDRRQGYRGPTTTLASAQWPQWRIAAEADLLNEIYDHRMGDIVTFVGPVTEVVLQSVTQVADLGLQGPVSAAVPDDLVFPGVVTGFDRRANWAWVDFAVGVGRLPAIGMLWAREPDPDEAAGRTLVDRPWDVLAVGDVIDVRRFQPSPDPPEWAKEREAELREAQTPMSPLLLSLEQTPAVQGALVSVLPETGEIVAVVGGYDFKQSQFNRALQAHRQPGSAFKPIVYSAALEEGFTPASILIDTAVVYEDVEREFRWKPKNYEGKFYGPMTLIDALTFSRNVVTIQLVREIGIPAIQEQGRSLGIESSLPSDLSMALGSGVLTPLEIVRAYSVFAANGRRPEMSLVREVWDANGETIYRYFPPVTDQPALLFSPFEKAPPPSPADAPFSLRSVAPVSSPNLSEFPEAVSADVAYQMTYLLRNVVNRGTGWRARALGRSAAGKTGTTDDNIDSWFVGYTPQVATAVWVGYDQLKPLGKYETGSRAASPIWTEYMQAVHRGLPVEDFPIPAGIVFRRIDAETGEPATPLSEKVLLVPFREGNEPDAVVEAGEERQSQSQAPLLKERDYMHTPGEW